MRVLLTIAYTLLGVGPVGVCAGAWLAVGAGAGIAAGSAACAALGAFLLLADVLPDPKPLTEATR